MKKGLTTHVEFDIPDEKMGSVHRLLVGLKAENIGYQSNGSSSVKKGEVAGRMHGITMVQAIFQIIDNHKDPRVDVSFIRDKVEEAGFSRDSVSTALGTLVQQRMITRVDRGVYSRQKALPAPTKKKG